MRVKWRFIDSNHLQEVYSGFMIRLIKGTWFHPKDFQPIPPGDMNQFEQALMIQSGMDHISALSQTQKVEYL